MAAGFAALAVLAADTPVAASDRGVANAPVSSVTHATQAVASSAALKREVFGFALASSLSDPTVGYTTWDFSLLSTVAFFRLYVNDDGTILTADNGWTVWNSAALTNLVTTAHNAGTKVVVTVDLQDFAATQPHMCLGLAHRATTVAKVVSEVAAKNVDGVNLDYEGMNHTCSNGKTTRAMMTALAHDMRAALPAGSYLSVDTYGSSAADGAGFFDVVGMKAYVDSFFVMAYDLEYSNWHYSPLVCSKFCLGPTAPLNSYHYNDTTIAAQYVSKVGASKVILGVPYYGRKSCVAYPKVNPYPTGTVTADSYLDAKAESSQPQVKPGTFVAHRDKYSTGGERWDSWFNTDMNCYRVLYWDDATSLGKKYDLVNAKGLRGVGIWNLNFGGGAPELWALLYGHFIGCLSAGLTADKASPQHRGAVVTFTATSTACNNPQYQFLVLAPGGYWKVRRAFSASATWAWDTTGYPAGTYQVRVWANQTGSPMNKPQAVMTITYVVSPSAACKTATIAPSPVTQPAGGSIAFTATSAQCPYPRYQFYVRLVNGTWVVKRGWSSDAHWTWNTAGLAPGVYYVDVWANQAGDSRAHAETYAVTKVTLTGCTSLTVTPSGGSSTVGTPVAFTAAASGCPSPQYEFWLRDPKGVWHLMRGWGTGSWTWSTTGWAKGSYVLSVWANQQGAYLGRPQVYRAVTYKLT